MSINKELVNDLNKAKEHIAELKIKLAELREALEKYGEHHAYCETAIHKPCNCGLRAALLQEKE